jgi:sensor domain CHASE-containing protein
MTAEDTPLYIVNPDVSCREEEPDGALLFDPDTDEVLVVNITGLLIWRVLAEPHNQEEVVDALVEQCNNIPADQVAQDVSEFLEQLIAKGFVGVYGAAA